MGQNEPCLEPRSSAATELMREDVVLFPQALQIQCTTWAQIPPLGACDPDPLKIKIDRDLGKGVSGAALKQQPEDISKGTGRQEVTLRLD